MAKPQGYKTIIVSPENLERLDSFQKSLNLRTRDDAVGALLNKHWFPIDRGGSVTVGEIHGSGGSGEKGSSIDGCGMGGKGEVKIKISGRIGNENLKIK